MSLLIVGSVAYDSVATGAGSRKDALGGSAAYASVAASYFTPVGIVAVVGDDFRAHDLELIRSHGVDTGGLERRAGRTFRWAGVYGAEDVNTRETLDTQLNVFADFDPVLRPEDRRRPYVFLANIDPELQMSVLRQMEVRPRLVALDTMNFWIEGKGDALRQAVEQVDVLFVDEGEVRGLTGEANLVRAARAVLEMGPSAVVVKRGEHGALLLQGDSLFAVPALPLESVVDPTGAGDSFAGGFLGYLAASGDLGHAAFRRAAAVGSVMGSLAVESFSLDRTAALTGDDIRDRFGSLTELCALPPPVDGKALPLRGGSE